MADLFIQQLGTGSWELRSDQSRGVLFDSLGLAVETARDIRGEGIMIVRLVDGREVAFDGGSPPDGFEA